MRMERAQQYGNVVPQLVNVVSSNAKVAHNIVEEVASAGQEHGQR